MKKVIFLLASIVFCQCLLSQIPSIIPSSNAIASTSVADSHSWTAFNNPAMLGYINTSEFALQYENRYLLSELSTKSVQFALPWDKVNTGISFSYFGYSVYHEMLTGINFARNFSDKFAIGVQFDYYTAYFSASNSYSGALFPQIGLSIRFSPIFNIGFHTFNPFQTNIKTEYVIKRLPSVFSLGTEYFFSKEFVWRTQAEKEVSSNYRIAMGFEYQMVQNINFKLGAYGSEYLVPCLGIGLKTRAFLLDLNCDIHPLLGVSPFAEIRYRFGK